MDAQCTMMPPDGVLVGDERRLRWLVVWCLCLVNSWAGVRDVTHHLGEGYGANSLEIK